ncbi:hypothetical protein SSE37_16073 [Sagittula stellata E-37]|uniref:Uncharacterized protein n=1 Tax=Sagittula stellata (strain ATCC 700073 / DSM 11524 / E-37) TaxID=388399 RepID=A3K2D6_SAGS3|nr:hypothetical protein SSE37_16073 [Sagittula stellata E-37]
MPSNQTRVRLAAVDIVFLHGRLEILLRDDAFAPQVHHCSGGDVVRVHLEELAQVHPAVRAAEAVGAQNGEALLDRAAHLFGVVLHVVRRHHDRPLHVGQGLGDVGHALFREGVETVVPLAVLVVAGQFVERGRRPDVGGDGKVLFQHLRRLDRLHEDRAGAHQVDVLLGGLVGLLHPVEALDDALFGAHRHFRVMIVLVHQGQVEVDVLLIHEHPLQAVLHDHRDFVRERRVVADAVRDGAGKDVAVAVLVLQTFAVQRSPPGGAAQHEAACAAVARRPGQVADPLEPEHRVVDVERDHRHAVVGIRRCRRDPVGHGPGLVDAFLKHLTALGFLVVGHLFTVFGGIKLPLRIVDAHRPEQPFHAEGAAFVRHDRHDLLAHLLVAQQRGEDADKGHGGGELSVARVLQLLLEGVEFRDLQLRRVGEPLGEGPAQFLAPLGQVGLLSVVERHERRVALRQFLVSHRNAEAVPHRLELVHLHLLLLVGGVLALAGSAHAVALDGLDQQNGRLALGLGGAQEGVVDLLRIVTAAAQRPDLIVGPVLHQFGGLRILAEEMLADVGAVLRLEGLVVAVDGLVHQLAQLAGGVLFEQFVPATAPEQLDHVPAGTAEVALKFLNDLGVAAHRTVEPLQVAVHDEDQVVQPFAGGKVDRAQRFRLVHLAVAEEGPDLAVLLLDQATVLHVFHETCLVDRHQRAKAHADRRELPVVRHEPGVRVGRQPLAADFGTELLELLFADPALHEGPRVDAGDHVALEEHQITAVDRALGTPEVVQADVIKRRGRRERCNVAAVLGRFLVPLHHRRHGIPAVDGADAPFHLQIAGHVDLVVRRNGVLVGGGRRKGQPCPGCPCALHRLVQQEMRAVRTVALDHVLDGFLPFLGFDRI